MNIIKTARKIKNLKSVKSAVTYAKKNHIKLKLFVLIAVCSVMIIRGIMQQPQILANKAEIERLQNEIDYEKERQEEIEDMRDMVETDEYIEKIARDKLGMIKKNEKIFIDVSKSGN
ncbi:MAG: septum formation initiator family protein [Clostridia bacterium]|nr:septum formation initiator family protein [Clostridia bacterium]